MCRTVYLHNKPFQLESGEVLERLEIEYTTYGQINEDKSNVIWIVHALTANSDPKEWWAGLIGTGKLFDTDKYFIVCANNLGSCYGTTGPASINPLTKVAYGKSFPLITIRDMVNAHDLLKEFLGISHIKLIIGGSLGGMISLEWNIKNPELFQHAVLIATNARHSAWGIAFNEAQRMAMSSDAGLEAARAIAMLSYRSYEAYNQTQTDNDEVVDNFKAASYQRYQGSKLAKRFDADSYYALTKAMDSHNVGRNRGGILPALSQVQAKVLVIGISSDVLFPIIEQKFLAEHIQNAQLRIIDSDFGHDGFLLEFDTLTRLVRSLIKQ